MTEENAKQKIGDRMEDGTIYAGISPDTNQPMYAAPVDASMSMDFNAAAKYAKDLDIGGKRDFRVPTKAELNVLYQNREKGALKGTFNLINCLIDRRAPTDYYWSSELTGYGDACVQRFCSGSQGISDMESVLSVRCVR
ncbi:MAG: DUF1566 domain-containing protein [Alphaproteobacteria bacterium]|nr:DUF1566 domain-containing protein [Alphaproteobacteria bacterium]